MPSYGTYATPRADLGVPFMEFWDKPGKFIADQALPTFPVMKKAATFSKITRESLLGDESLKRASKSTYSRGEFAGEDDTYSCEEYGHEIPVGDDEMELYATDFDAGATAIQAAALKLKIDREKRASAALFNATTWTGASLFTDVSTTWATTASATILADIEAAKVKVSDLTGMEPDTLIVNSLNWGYIKLNTGIWEAMKYTKAPTEAEVRMYIADFLGITKILVGPAVYNSAKEGQTFSATKVWSSSYAMVCLTPETASLQEPCVGRSFLWTPDSANSVTTESYREEQTRSTVYRARHNMDEKVFDASFGHLLKVD